MVFGEPQILGQLKQHYDAAQQAGSVGTILHRLFHRSFSVAKRVRSETGIARGAFPPRPSEFQLWSTCSFAAVCRMDYQDAD